MENLRRCSLAVLALFLGCRERSDVAQVGTVSTVASAPSAEVISPAPSSETSSLGALTPLANGVAWARSERKDAANRNTVWTVLRLALGEAQMAIAQPPNARLEQLVGDATIVAAVNGGFFETTLAPSGLLVSRGRQMGAFDPRGGSGVLVVDQGRARLVTADAAASKLAGDIAVQCGPRLVEPGSVIGIRSDDGKRASRTVACIRDDGRELDLVMAWTRNSDRDGPSLFEMAHWLVQPLVAGDKSGCDAALNLDGGPSTGLVLRDRPDELHKPFGRVPFAIVVSGATEKK